MNKKLKKQIEEAMKAEWNVKESYNDDLYEELAYQDFINNLGDYGMHIEYIPIELDEDIKDLVKEYSACIISNPSKINEFLKELIEDVRDYYLDK